MIMHRVAIMASDLGSVLEYKNNAVTQRISEKLELNKEQAVKLFEDCSKFLWLSETEEKPIAPSPKIDEAWHIFLLFTRDYQEFCQTYFGHFKHHRPLRSEDPTDDGAVMRRTFSAIGFHFGGFVNLSENWSYAKASCVSCDTPSTSCQEPRCG